MHFLHLHSSFDAGGKELRAAQLINAFGPGIRHAIVSAVPGAMGAIAAIRPELAVGAAENFPPLQGRPTPGRLLALARAMLGYDLILTYNFGAMDAVLAHTLFAGHLRLPPLVHHEDGFNADEAGRLKPARNWYRRIALHGAAALVVPSTRLEEVARTAWAQAPGKLRRIANGIPVAAYAARSPANALPRVIKRDGELWLGTLAGLKPVKRLDRLVRAFAALPEPWQLVIVGEGPERDALRDSALELGLAHRVHLPGFVPDPARVVGLFDLFALASDSEQFPLSVVEAMAGGLAIAAPAVGDIAAMVAEENRRFITEPGDEAALAAALATLAGDAALRRTLGEANRTKARTAFDEATMVAAYVALYGAVIGRPLPVQAGDSGG